MKLNFNFEFGRNKAVQNKTDAVIANPIDKKTLGKELATRETVNSWFGYGLALSDIFPNPDPVLKKLRKDIDAYEEVLADDHVYGMVETRKSAILSNEYLINKNKASEDEYNVIKRLFNDINLDEKTSEILDAQYFGYQPIELVWENVGKYWLPVKVEAKPREWFKFDNENKLRLLTYEEPFEGVICPEDKFLLPRHNPSYNNPYGDPILSRCYWNVFFKKNTLKFWATFTEKYGMPWLIGKYLDGTAQTTIDNFMETLVTMSQDNIVLMPKELEEFKVEQTGTTMSAEIYDMLCDRCNKANSVVILGHTGASIDTAGKLGKENMAEGSVEGRIASDKKLVTKTYNELIKLVHKYNFNGDEVPVFEFYEESDIKKETAERDVLLTQQGVDFNEDYYSDIYNIDKKYFVLKKIEEQEEPTESKPEQDKAVAKYQEQLSIPPEAGGGLANTIQKMKIDFLNAAKKKDKPAETVINSLEILEKFEEFVKDTNELKDIKVAIVKPILDLIEKDGEDYKLMLDDLFNIYPDMPSKELREFLLKIMNEADVCGFSSDKK